MSYRELRKALLKKAGITKQALSMRVQKVISDLPMTAQDATCVVAYRAGIRVDRYLAPDDLARVRDLLTKTLTSVRQTTRAKHPTSKPPGEHVIKFAERFTTTDAMLPRTILSQAVEMAKVYPLIYVLENSIRELIERVMVAGHGHDWWDSKFHNAKIRGYVASRMSDDQKDAWHQRRGARPIDYVDLKDLPSIVTAFEADFVPDLLPEMAWFRALVLEVYKSRCVVCHMNPLHVDNVDAVRVRARQWARQINAKKALIPGRSSGPSP
jgi:hypothetical protein